MNDTDTRVAPAIEVHEPAFANLVMHNAPLEQLATGFRWTEGPVWFGDAGALLFSDIPNDRIMRWVDGIGVSVYRSPAQFANGHARDTRGRLVGCSHGMRALTRTEYDGTVTVLADKYRDRRLNSPNDVVVKSDGSIWFTDPPYGITSDYEGLRADQELPCHVYRLSPDGTELTVVADDFAAPNGLAFSPDERLLYVSDTGAPGDANATTHVRVFDVVDGVRLRDGTVFYSAAVGVVDGLRCDESGRVWTSAADGVHCVRPDGVLLGIIRIPETVANLTFGGRMRSRLFICASTSLYAIYLKTRGVIGR